MRAHTPHMHTCMNTRTHECTERGGENREQEGLRNKHHYDPLWICSVREGNDISLLSHSTPGPPWGPVLSHRVLSIFGCYIRDNKVQGTLPSARLRWEMNPVPCKQMAGRRAALLLGGSHAVC